MTNPYGRWVEQANSLAVSFAPEGDNVTLGVTGPLPGSVASAASFNGTSSYVALPSKVASQTGYQSLSM